METVAKHAQTRTTDRVLEALSTLAALLNRTINEVQGLDGDFQTRLLQAVNDTEASLQQQAATHLENAVADAQQAVRLELTEQLRQQFEADKNSVLQAALLEWEAEREKFNREIDHAAQSAARWEAERSRLNSEIDAVRQELTEKNHQCARLSAEIEEQRAVTQTAPAPPPPAASGGADDVDAEIRRVESLIDEMTRLMDDPATDLSMVIRKNVERTELDSYLRGIRFAIKGRDLK